MQTFLYILLGCMATSFILQILSGIIANYICRYPEIYFIICKRYGWKDGEAVEFIFISIVEAVLFPLGFYDSIATFYNIYDVLHVYHQKKGINGRCKEIMEKL